jgi:hypothetical protein
VDLGVNGQFLIFVSTCALILYTCLSLSYVIVARLREKFEIIHQGMLKQFSNGLRNKRRYYMLLLSNPQNKRYVYS